MNSLLPPSWRLLMAQIIQCLGGKTEGFDQITNKDAIILYSLANGINIDYARIFWKDIIIKLNKRHREKVVPYTRFLSLLTMHKMKECYRDGTKPRHKKHPTSLKQLSLSSKKETKVGSSKAPTSSKIGHSKKRKEFRSAMDSNPSQPLVSTPVDIGMHKEDQQATGGLTSLGAPVKQDLTLNSVVSALGNDALAVSITEADPEKSAPSDFVPQQQGMNEGTKNTSYDQLFVVEEDKTSRTIKLEDLAKLVSSVQPSFKDLDSPKNGHIIVVDDSDEDEEADELTNQVLILQSQNHKLELEKNKAEAEVALLKAQPSFSNMGHLNELLIKSLQTKFSKILYAQDFSSSLPTELKDLPSKFNELTEEVKGLKQQVASVQAKQKTLDALPGLLLNVIKALDKFAQVLDSASSKAGDQSVPSAGQADTMPAEGEKNTNQATISQLFQKRAEKNVKNENLDSQQLKPIPPIITTTTQMQSLLQSPPKSSSQPEEEHIKKDKGKKAMSSEESDIIK
ncbi:hypothetical protein Tco_1119138 [Tanacetum coccineum]